MTHDIFRVPAGFPPMAPLASSATTMRHLLAAIAENASSGKSPERTLVNELCALLARLLWDPWRLPPLKLLKVVKLRPVLARMPFRLNLDLETSKRRSATTKLMLVGVPATGIHDCALVG